MIGKKVRVNEETSILFPKLGIGTIVKISSDVLNIGVTWDNETVFYFTECDLIFEEEDSVCQ